MKFEYQQQSLGSTSYLRGFLNGIIRGVPRRKRELRFNVSEAGFSQIPARLPYAACLSIVVPGKSVLPCLAKFICVLFLSMWAVAEPVQASDFVIIPSPHGYLATGFRRPSVAFDATLGRAIVVAQGHNIFSQLVDLRTGDRIGSTVELPSNGEASAPHVIFNPTRNSFLVAWGLSGSFNVSPNKLFLREIDRDGNPVGATIRISVSNKPASLVFNPVTNEILVVWSDYLANAEIHGIRINAATLQQIGGTVQISNQGGSPSDLFAAWSPDVAVNSDSGEYLVVFSGENNTGALVDNEYEIWGQRLSSNCTLLGPSFRLSVMGPDGSTSYNGTEPSVSFNSTNKNYLVVWRGDTNAAPQVDNEYEIWGQSVSQAGIPTGDMIRVSAMGPDGDPSYSAGDPQVAYIPSDNEFLVTWTGDTEQDDLHRGQMEVFSQAVDGATGMNARSVSRVSNSSGKPKSAALALDSAHAAFLVVWNDVDESAAAGTTLDGINGNVIANKTVQTRISSENVPDVALVGDVFTLDLVVANDGPSAASNLELRFTIPVNVTLRDLSMDGANCVGESEVLCNIPSLAPNSSHVAHVTMEATRDLKRSVSISLDSKTWDSDFADNFATATIVVDLDSDHDGTRNGLDSDDDNDGLADSDEIALGTATLDPDTDFDGISDGQEVAEGSNPVDAGSAISRLETTFCSEWNGFFGGSMWNVMEHINLSESTKSITAAVFDIAGALQSEQEFTVLPGAQTDLLVHDMPGRVTNSYGKVCSTHAGNVGDVDGRMVYYKPIGDSFEFALAMPFSNGKRGSQFVPFNTFQPSLFAADRDNLVTNWIQLTNLEGSVQHGILSVLDQNGVALGSQLVTLSPGSRRDFSAHQYGTNRVGLVQWVPEGADARFQMRNVRYYYNNPGTVDSFDSAFQLEAEKGTGEEIVVPLDTVGQTAVLEIANVLSNPQLIRVHVFTSEGSLAHEETLLLPAGGSRHIVVDPFLPQMLGNALIQGETDGGVIATAMHYGRLANGGIDFVYGVQASQALGENLRGSYNSFLEQTCELLIVNSKTTSTTVALSLTRYDGSEVIVGQQEIIPGHGAVRLPICSSDEPNSYGVVHLQLAEKNSIMASVIRHGKADAYRFPTPVRE